MTTASATATDPAVYADRLTRVQAELASQNLDWLLLGISADLRYLTGHGGHLSERLTLLMVPRAGPFGERVDAQASWFSAGLTATRHYASPLFHHRSGSSRGP